MLESILNHSIKNRWIVVLATALVAGVGIWSLGKLPIDAVPDITNNQVQINAVAQWFRAGDGCLHRRRRHIFRSPTGERAARRGEGFFAARR